MLTPVSWWIASNTADETEADALRNSWSVSSRSKPKYFLDWRIFRIEFGLGLSVVSLGGELFVTGASSEMDMFFSWVFDILGIVLDRGCSLSMKIGHTILKYNGLRRYISCTSKVV